MRVSGSNAKEILHTLTGREGFLPRRASLAPIYSKNETAPFDRPLVLWFPGPASYTGEDVFELHLHGGLAVTEAASSALLAAGATPAGPGEFTRRAFENGKLDLVQAEAVADIIDAQTQGQLEQAQRQLRGDLGALYGGWREDLGMIRAQIEACIDFPEEEDVLADALKAIKPKMTALVSCLDAHLDDSTRGMRIRDGLSIVLIGPANAGKSTLLNRLAGEEAAIVSDEPGTTRDVVRVRLDMGGFLVELADTAGIREITHNIEKEGIKRAKTAAEAADIRIMVVDITQPAADLEHITALLHDGDYVVFNKQDKVNDNECVPDIALGILVKTHRISATSGEGVDALISALEKRIIEMLGCQEAPSMTRMRHKQAIENTTFALVHAMQQLGARPELAGEHLREAGAALGEITGEAGTEEILGKIFSTFCIGK